MNWKYLLKLVQQLNNGKITKKNRARYFEHNFKLSIKNKRSALLIKTMACCLNQRSCDLPPILFSLHVLNFCLFDVLINKLLFLINREKWDYFFVFFWGKIH